MQVLYVEPFESGSHASFTRSLSAIDEVEWTQLTLPGRHWKWRMRGVAPWAALDHADVLAAHYDLLLASSYVPLAELVGLAPSLSSVPRILYFHENQLTYPARGISMVPRDNHFGFTQLVSSLAATRCVFNSAYNRDSFLTAGRELLARMPDAVPHQFIETIAARSEVLGVPLRVSDEPVQPDLPPHAPTRARGPLIVWNHRWEYDKDPDSFFSALLQLADRAVPFRLAVCGQRFSRVPPVFEQARVQLGQRVVHWGYCASVEDYRALLSRAQLVVSTARHEFFGLAMLEATHWGAYPLVPDRLAYPELFTAQFRYADLPSLVDRLESCCRAWVAGTPLRGDRRSMTAAFRVDALLPRYVELFKRVVKEGPPSIGR